MVSHKQVLVASLDKEVEDDVLALMSRMYVFAVDSTFIVDVVTTSVDDNRRDVDEVISTEEVLDDDEDVAIESIK